MFSMAVRFIHRSGHAWNGLGGGKEGECVYTTIAWEYTRAYIHEQYDVNEDS
jgi:hypothetical protein